MSERIVEGLKRDLVAAAEKYDVAMMRGMRNMETALRERIAELEAQVAELVDIHKNCHPWLKASEEQLREEKAARVAAAEAIDEAIDDLDGTTFCGRPNGDMTAACHEECGQCRAKWVHDQLVENRDSLNLIRDRVETEPDTPSSKERLAYVPPNVTTVEQFSGECRTFTAEGYLPADETSFDLIKDVCQTDNPAEALMCHDDKFPDGVPTKKVRVTVTIGYEEIG